MPLITDSSGHAVTAATPEAAAALAAVTDSYVRFHRDPGERLKAALTLDPDMPMAHILKGYFFKLFGSDGAAQRAAKTSAALTGVIARTGASEREEGHRAALAFWCAEDIDGATACWERILQAHPRDILALRLAHFAHFYAGEGGRMRDSVARALPAWDAADPHYANVLGMYAFGLEEAGEYREAERVGRRAVERDPEDAWAVHAVAHVMETEGRTRDGIEWVRNLEPHWSVVNNFRFHLHWHRALYHLERFQFDAVLRLYDEEIASDLEADMYLDLVNCASLLWRLQAFGVDVGERWAALGDVAQRHLDDHELIFVSLHYLLALIGAGAEEAASGMLTKLRAYAREASNQTSNQPAVCAAVGIASAEAMIALKAGQHDRAVECLWPVRSEIYRIGGSHAQRDLFEMMLATALLHSKHTERARAYLAERATKAPNSLWTWQRLAEIYERGGAADAGRHAEAMRAADALLEGIRSDSATP